jgi:hypothetical protein
VTTDATPTPDLPDPARRDNGLLSDSYVPLTDVATDLGPALLAALARARIAAYLVDTPTRPEAPEGTDETHRLYVASDERADARTIVAAVIKSVGGDPGSPPPPPPVNADPLAGIDADAAFAELIADWHVDTHLAIKEAEKALNREDEDWRARLRQSPPPTEPVWLDDEHYVPPVPPPLPRFAAPTILAMTVLVISILLLGLGGQFGLANQLTLLLGVCGVLLAVTMLVMRLRADPDDEDDGAIL